MKKHCASVLGMLSYESLNAVVVGLLRATPADKAEGLEMLPECFPRPFPGLPPAEVINYLDEIKQTVDLSEALGGDITPFVANKGTESPSGNRRLDDFGYPGTENCWPIQNGDQFSLHPDFVCYDFCGPGQHLWYFTDPIHWFGTWYLAYCSVEGCLSGVECTDIPLTGLQSVLCSYCP